MPLVELDTSCELSDGRKKDALARTLSRLVAEGTGKPEQYVMACVREKVAMIMAGEPGPCALVTIKAIGGLTGDVNGKLSASLSEMLQEELAIASDCVYVTFEELAPTHWGWKGKTFA